MIDGTLTKPEALGAGADDEARKKHKEASDRFRKANSFAESAITSTISDEVYQKVIDKTTAHKLWEALKAEFEATAEDQIFRLCNDFFSFSWSPGEDVSTLIAKL